MQPPLLTQPLDLVRQAATYVVPVVQFPYLNTSFVIHACEQCRVPSAKKEIDLRVTFVFSELERLA